MVIVVEKYKCRFYLVIDVEYIALVDDITLRYIVSLRINIALVYGLALDCCEDYYWTDIGHRSDHLNRRRDLSRGDLTSASYIATVQQEIVSENDFQLIRGWATILEERSTGVDHARLRGQINGDWARPERSRRLRWRATASGKSRNTETRVQTANRLAQRRGLSRTPLGGRVRLVLVSYFVHVPHHVMG